MRCRWSEDVLLNVSLHIWKYLRCETISGKSRKAEKWSLVTPDSVTDLFLHYSIHCTLLSHTVLSTVSPLHLRFSLIGLSQRRTRVMKPNDTFHLRVCWNTADQSVWGCLCAYMSQTCHKELERMIHGPCMLHACGLHTWLDTCLCPHEL